jgi:hypothetical protein
MPAAPTTKYAKSGEVHIAYQVVGEGANDLVFEPGWVSHVWKSAPASTPASAR